MFHTHCSKSFKIGTYFNLKVILGCFYHYCHGERSLGTVESHGMLGSGSRKWGAKSLTFSQWPRCLCYQEQEGKTMRCFSYATQTQTPLLHICNKKSEYCCRRGSGCSKASPTQSPAAHSTAEKITKTLFLLRGPFRNSG